MLPVTKVNDTVYAFGVVIEYDQPTGQPDTSISLSTAAFNGFHDSFNYRSDGQWLFHLNSEGGGSEDGVYLAPVYLPQGATIVSAWFNFYDGSTSRNAAAFLVRTRNGVNENLASAVTTGQSSGYTPMFTTVDQNGRVDNTQYA